MQNYFDRKSAYLSLPVNKAESTCYSAQPGLSNHDAEVINVFLNLFSRHVPKFFAAFSDLTITCETRPDYVLAAAAVGGLYCTTTGSFDFSRAMYNDSRRLLLASVRQNLLITCVYNDRLDEIHRLV